MTRIDGYIIAGGDGTLQNTTTKDKKTGVVLPAINVTTDNGVIQALYTQSGNDKKSPIKNNTSVSQGNIVGKSIDIKDNPAYNNTVNHTHIEIFERYRDPINDRTKIGNQDPTNILFPNKVKVPIGLPNTNNK